MVGAVSGAPSTPEALRRADAPPQGAAAALRALWHAARGEWDAAHRLVQDESGRDAAWVHAHLHRVEGDHGNARYWYSRAGQPPSEDPLEQEWDKIALELLDRPMS
jgi:hypothetical protein